MKLWTMHQWSLAYELIKSNEWKLKRFIDASEKDQTNVALDKLGTREELERFRDAFKGSMQAERGQADLKGAGETDNTYIWMLGGDDLDDFLDHIWLILKRVDPHFRASDVNEAQKIRERVKQGCSYPWWDHRSKVKA